MPIDRSERQLQDRLEEVSRLLETHRVLESLTHRQEGPKRDLLEALTHRQNLAELTGRLKALHPADLAQILEVLENSCSAKCFAGYAGWSPGQLEAEMESQAWLVTSATPAQVFGKDNDLYRRLLTNITLSPWIDPSRIPDDPNLN